MIDFRVALLLALTVKLSISCLASGNNSGGDVPVRACQTCKELKVQTNTGIGTDSPVTQTISTDTNGCTVNTVTCGSATTTSVIFGLDEVPLGIIPGGSGPIRCDDNGNSVITFTGPNAIKSNVDSVACISPPFMPPAGK